MPRIPVSPRAVVASTTFLLILGCQPPDRGSPEGWRSGLLSAGPSIEGRYEQRVASMYDGTARYSHHIRTDDGVFEVSLPDGTEELAYNTIVRAWGETDGPTFHADELEVIARPPEPLIDPEQYPHRRIATVIVKWEGAGAMDNATAKSSMFINETSTNVFYGENSYGKEKIAGDVFGPYTIDNPGGCSPDLIADRGLQRFIEKGHNPDDFQQFMWWFPGLSDCGFGGLASIGSVLAPARNSWYNGSFGCVVRNQEIGHNYGMGHSHSYNCTDGMGNAVPLSDECEHVEYGDPYDPMGGGCAHMNVTQKAYMGWLEGCNIVHTTSSGTFNLLPTELPCNGTQALSFPAYDGRDYYLEYRQPLGVDDGFNAVLLHISNSYDFGPSPYILDVGDDGFLGEGATYTDPQGTVSFTVVDMSPERAVIEVTFPDGGSGSPTCSDGSDPGEADGHVGIIECAAEPFPLDTNPPTVEITYPLDGDTFEPGADFDILAEAMDDRGITEAELYLDGEPIYKKFDPPFSFPVTNIPEGTYEFGVVVRDGPNQGASQAVTIRVGNFPDASTGAADGTGSDEGPQPSTSDEPMDDSAGGDDSSGGGTNLDSVSDRGCGCTSAGQSGGAGLFAFVLGAAALRRRRRARPPRGVQPARLSSAR